MSVIDAMKEATKSYELHRKFMLPIYNQFIEIYPDLKKFPNCPNLIQLPDPNYNNGRGTEGWITIDITMQEEDLPYLEIPTLPFINRYDSDKFTAIYYKSEVLKINEVLRDIDRFSHDTNLGENENGIELILSYKVRK